MIKICSGKITIPEEERFIGFAGDNLHSTKQFIIDSATDENCVYRLYLTFDDGSVNFFVLDSEVTNGSTVLTWNILTEHIFKSGIVMAQIKCMKESGEVYHTNSDYFEVGDSAEFSEEFKDNDNAEFLRYEKELNAILEKINSSSIEGGLNGITPHIGENGNWFIGETDTGLPSRGADGKNGDSPTVSLSLINGGYQLSVLNPNAGGATAVNIMHGKDGTNGKDGSSVYITNIGESTADGGQNVVIFNDGKTLTVKNGSKGSKGDKGDTGEKGADGKTPVKGVDYFTESEKAEFLESITSKAEIPDYVIAEADEVVDKVLQSQGNRTFTFAAISDLHYGNSNYKDGIKHAFQAMNHISKHIKLDMIAVLGDYTDGYPSTDITDAMADFKAINSLLDSVRFAPNIRQMGNHDYYADNIPVTRRLIQSHSDNVVWGDRLGGYFYRDFEDYKLRVICLNTNENNPIDASTNKPTSNISMTKEQCQWFADTLNMSDKDNASEWQILVLSHQPLDYWANNSEYHLSYIVDAYKNGTSWSDGNVSCDYTDKNQAVLIGNIHGHIHNLLTDTMYRGNSNSSEKTSVYRLSTPNACFGRENQYTGAFSEVSTYSKTQNSALDTSFIVYCIDLDTYTVKAICYGAGYDRELVYNIPSIGYTNQLPIAIDTDGSIYNGKGFIDDTRLNSSGTTAAATGASTTGFIPVSENAVVRLKNVGIATTDSTTDYIRLYDENFANLLGCKTNQLSGNTHWINTVVTDETTGYITSFTLSGAYGAWNNVKYMRLSTRVKLDDTAIITVNEEIV